MIRVVMHMAEGGMPQPISFVREIKPYVSGLKEAHDILCRIAAGQTIEIELDFDVNIHTFRSVIETIEKYGVEIKLIHGKINET